ncbi:MAG: pirin family protein [Bacteriovoracaceae bacterium]
MSSIELVITPKEKDLGDNFVVRRSLPDHRKRMVEPFIFWDHMGPAKITPEKGMKVKAHPHIDLATITWLFYGMSLRLVAGSYQEKTSPVPVYSNLFYFNGRAAKGKQVEIEVSESQEAAVYIIDGNIKTEDKTYNRYDLIIFKKGENLLFNTLEDRHFMIFGGKIFQEKRHMWWNFVSTSKEKIEIAKTKWKNGEYPSVINEQEVIPLPEN